MYIHDREELRRNILIELKKAFTENKKPAFIYDRVSTKQQEVTGTSLQQQEFKGKKYAQENEFYIAKSFITAESAYKTGRRIFNLMLDLAIEMGVKDIVFMCTDRMSRNFQDWSRLKSLIDEHDFNIHFYQEGVVINKKSHYTEKLVMNIKLSVAEGHSDKVSHDSKQTAIWKVKNGIYPAGTPPFGYSYSSAERKFLKNKNGDLLMQIFDLYDSQNYTAQGICDYINSQGHKTQKGNPWNKTTVLRILSSVFYTGRFEYEGNVYQGTHEPYIDNNRYAKRISGMELKYKGARTRENNYILKGMLRSGATGKMLTGDMKKERYVYYTSRRGGYLSFKEDDVFKLLDDKIRLIHFSPDFEGYLKDLFRQSVQVDEKGHAKEQESTSKEIARLEKEQQKLLQLLIDGVDEKAVRERMDENKKIITRLENRHQQIRINKTDFILQTSEMIDGVRDAFEVYDRGGKPEKADILRSMCSEILVFDDTVSIVWRDPYSFILDERVIQAKNSLPQVTASSNLLREGSPTVRYSNLRELVFKELSPAWQSYYVRSA